MEEQDILDAPTKINLFTWLNNLFLNNNAEYDMDNPNIINLDSYGSSWFCIGRNNDNMEGFVGVPRNLLPWFLDIGFKNAYISFENRRLYLSCGNKNEIGFTLSIKIREKRMSLLWNKDNKEDHISKLNFLMFNIKADNNILLKEETLDSIPLSKVSSVEDVVYNKRMKKKISKEDMLADQIRARFQEEYFKKYID